MKKLSALIALASVALASNVSKAAPRARYFPVDGRIEIINDFGSSLANATVQSPNGLGMRANGGLFLQPLPGALKHDSEFPFAFTYLSLPTGTSNAGLVGMPGLSLPFDLFFEYRTTSLTGPLIRGVIEIPTLLDLDPELPEPAAMAMAGLGLVGLVGFAHRRNPH